ncbi:MAG TPA: ImmA/IrrE family metallo-endopeptidase [Candidatus Acidoferrum sp.]|nr:ImmA/IrrE family metallo-endopeptidase [Candidatus Acidoferrum sp.]
MLQRILNAAGLEARDCAGLLGLNPDVVSAWALGQEAIPDSFLPLLSAVLSVSPSLLINGGKGSRRVEDADITPQIWFKFRGAGLVQADRESVILIRTMGHYLNELEEVTRQKSIQWKSIFDAIRNGIDIQAPAKEQGKAAARIFRQATSLGHGATGGGEILRGLLRAIGVLAVEIPISGSAVEGCSFYVGAVTSPRPCIFANGRQATWFRRNVVLMHELGHSIFEPFTGATLDLVGSSNSEDIEVRAQAFAQEALVPKEVLLHIAQENGCNWVRLNAMSLAQMVASTHVELRTLLAAGVDAGFITPEQEKELGRVDISDSLHAISPHALTTEEFLEKTGIEQQDWIGRRNTTLTSRSILLPVGYVKSVVEAYRNRQISPSKAAAYLMIDRNEFLERFGDIYEEIEA